MNTFSEITITVSRTFRNTMRHPRRKIILMALFFVCFTLQHAYAKHYWPNEMGGIKQEWLPQEGVINLSFPVWDDHGSDALTWNAGFSPNSGWLDLTIGSSTFRVYCDSGNGKGGNATCSQTKGSDKFSYTKSRSGTIDWIHIKFYVPQGLLNTNVNIGFNGVWWNDGATSDQTISQSLSISTTATLPDISIENPVFTQSEDKPQVSISWNKLNGGTTEIRNLGKINLRKESSNGEIISSVETTEDSGTFLIDATDIDLIRENKYVVTQDFSVENISVSSTSNTVTLPAYPQVNKIEGAFDESQRQIKISWSVGGTSSQNYIKDNFLLSYNYSLNGQTEKTELVKIPYSLGVTNYTYNVDIPEKAIGTYNFSIIREKTKDLSAWNNKFKKELNNVTINTIHLSINDSHVVLLENGKSLIYWKTNGDVWSNGSKFVLTRQNITLNTVEDIELPKNNITDKPSPDEFTSEEEYNKYKDKFEDDNSGAYIDDMLQLCNEYRYKLQVKPNPLTYSPLEPIYTPESIIPTDQGDLVAQMSASKGYFTDRVEISWSVIGATFDNFSVRRRIYDPDHANDDNYDQIASVSGAATQSTYSVEDKNCVPGLIYQYKIVGLSNCANKVVESKTQPKTIGFRAPTGQIIGRITFTNSEQAVEGVDVRVSGPESLSGQSVKFEGNADSYLETDNNLPQTSLAYTIQAYVKPSTEHTTGTILQKGNYEIGLDAGIPYFKITKGTQSESVTATQILTPERFSHISAVCKQVAGKTQMVLYLYTANEAGIDTLSVYTHDVSLSNIQKEAGKAIIGKNLNGHIDEVRVWDRSLTQEEIIQNHNRFLAANEDGLAAYWRFDEPVTSEFYDLSFYRTKYNENHGKSHNITLDKKVIPEPDQLSFRGVTDKNGNYRITGVPYSGDGTEYTLVPYFGTHQFSPGEKTIVIGQTSSMFNIDFKDFSSFKIEGTVYYEKSTIPVEGVMFYIDGKIASLSNGEIISSSEDGKFSINVPVGQHEVKAAKQNHIFVNDGKLKNSFNADLDYQENKSDIRFWDATRVRVIGRIAGGTIQDTIPVGHSLSKNNLGEKISLTLQLKDDSKGKIFYYEDKNTGNTQTEETVTIKHFHPEHKNTIKSNATSVTITTDPETGEFVADLIPEQYKIANIAVTGYTGLKDENILDLSNAFNEQNSIYSLLPDEDGTVKEDTVKYNKIYKFIHRIDPVVRFSQINGMGKTYFGSLDYKIMNLDGKTEQLTLYNEQKNEYLMGKPIFEKGKTYKFKIDAYEEYPFYRNISKNSAPEITSYDKVPVKGGTVKISNGFAKVTNEPYTLDKNGSVTVAYQTKEPDLNNIEKNIEVTFEFNGKTISAPSVTGYHIGGVQTGGKDFVTEGPTEALMILRDPPGSQSYAYAEEGLTISNKTTITSGSITDSGAGTTALMGLNLTTSVGVGVETETSVDSENSLGVTVSTKSDDNESNSTVSSTTLNTRFQTSNDPLYDGRNGDLIVANSTNITYGIENLLGIAPIGPNAGEDIKETVGNYCISSKKTLSIGKHFGTLLVYPQIFIEQTLLPKLTGLRDAVLLDKGTTDTYAKTLANERKTPVYVSKYDKNNENFGKTNTDAATFDGDSYKIIFPDGYDDKAATDTIASLNNSIDSWIKILADNEQKKVESILFKNFSFQAGAGIEYSEEYSTSEERNQSFSFTINNETVAELGATVNGFGAKMTINEAVETNSTTESGSSEEKTKKIGFVLQEEGDDDYISVDIRKEKGTSTGTDFVYYTQGGATSCPYEGPEVTRYFEPGKHKLSEGTLRIEVPKIEAAVKTISGVPSNKAAVFKLLLSNDSEAQEDAIYILKMDDASNKSGAKFSIDGVALSTGRAFVVPYGNILEKTLEVRMGDKYDYENMNLILASQCQYDPTDFLEDIADTVSLSVHFIPTSTDVNIKSPGNNWVLNLNSPKLDNGTHYLPITVDGFDINFRNFHHIAVQYKPSSSSDKDWQNIKTFYANDEYYNQAQETEKAMIEGSVINCNFSGTLDQSYDIRAVSYCTMGTGYVTSESNVVSGKRDLVLPKLFGTPKPASGILGIDDNIQIDFNEALAEGYFTNANFEVTAIKNGSNGNHDVSVYLNGETDYLSTEFDKNMTDKSMTLELWVKPRDPNRSGTLFTHGNNPDIFEVSLTSDKRIEVQLDNKKYTSNVINMASGQWAHIAVVYDNDRHNLKAFYNYESVINQNEVPPYKGIGKIEFGRNVNKTNYFAGGMHEARFWDEARSISDIKSKSLSILSGMESSLVTYLPMDEGEGSLIIDKARGNNASLHGTWSTPAGKATQFDNATGMLIINSSEIPIKEGEDFTLEFWFRTTATTQADAALVDNGKADGNEQGNKANKFFVGFENNQLIFRSKGYKEIVNGFYMNREWHHFAISVNRNSGNAQIFMDGELKNYFRSDSVGGISGSQIYLGACCWLDPKLPDLNHKDRFFSGQIDELRIWNSALTQSIISRNTHKKMNGSEMGLIAYYPFEKYIVNTSNIKELIYTLEDQAQKKYSAVAEGNASETDEKAPLKSKGPEQNVKYSFVTNGSSIIINLEEAPEVLEKTIVNVALKDVRDLNGNVDPTVYRWSAYIDRNQLKWGESKISIDKTLYEPYEFQVTLSNVGGSIKNFTLESLPAWLSADPMGGELNPKESKKITFTIDEGTNVGTYEEVIYVKGENNVTEPLQLSLKVNSKKPEWTVNPADYKYNMSLFGKIRINTIFSTDKEDLLAAFENGKCIGVANNSYDRDQDMWYTFLTIFNNKKQTNDIEFRIWDASTGKIYYATPDKTIRFVNDGVEGTPKKPIIFDGKEILFQNIDITEGWNWISFNLSNIDLTKVSATLKNGNWTTSDIVKNQNFFDSYSKNKGWTGTLTQNGGFDNVSLYMIHSSDNQILSVDGSFIDPKTAPINILGNRWNYIGYLPSTNITVKEAMAGYDAQEGDILKSQNQFCMYSGTGWIGNLKYMEPNKGYMLLRTASDNVIFTYPSSSGILTEKKEQRNKIATYSLMPDAYTNYNYAENMSIIAISDEVKPGDKIKGYIDGILRGVSEGIKVGERILNFISISGDNSDREIRFELDRQGETIARSRTIIPYRSNNISGTVLQPVKIDFGFSVKNASVYPNPFTDILNIRVSTNPGDRVEIAVYNILGQPVIQWDKKVVQSNIYQVSWNGTMGNLSCEPGIYLVRVNVNGTTSIHKIEKQ
ncbi:T9SS type A sorting domain-containing protein [Coprobacter sp. LH1063]|uniref:T9SS type A sorting domain-containing protein n=2 Tax=Coprobacter tertius TaxID=2944915 RepID=A0ABT1MCY6_9BACT|nr:T9SS type A sorting domain-containing protein [Coprobacter tertius]